MCMPNQSRPLPDSPEGHHVSRSGRAIFKNRLGWEVNVNDRGRGTGSVRYDAMNPLYVIWELEAHGNPRRFDAFPAHGTGRTMINEHFSHLMDGVRIESPVDLGMHPLLHLARAPTAGRVGSPGARCAGELMDNFPALEHFCRRVRSAHGADLPSLIMLNPDVIGSAGEGQATSIGVGLCGDE